MIVQWCCKGVTDLDASEVIRILTRGPGIVCRLWQENDPLPYDDALSRLNENQLDLHVNHYDEPEPGTGLLVSDITPFISLSAGCVSREVWLKTNVLHPARRTALLFATDKGQSPGWVFTCYVLVSVNRAAGIPAVAEEVRELSHNRPYSPYYVEGEVAAKINVPSPQILCAERWEPSGSRLRRPGLYLNRTFVPPAAVLDERRML